MNTRSIIHRNTVTINQSNSIILDLSGLALCSGYNHTRAALRILAKKKVRKHHECSMCLWDLDYWIKSALNACEAVQRCIICFGKKLGSNPKKTGQFIFEEKTRVKKKRVSLKWKKYYVAVLSMLAQPFWRIFRLRPPCWRISRVRTTDTPPPN